MRELGTIVRLQAQPVSLKVGDPPNRRYDPSTLTEVATLTVTEGGVAGWVDDGPAVPDIHHRDHPASKNRKGGNGISICFTSHYRRLRREFGDHVVDGVGGENILVETDDEFTLGDLEGGITVQSPDGRSLHLTDVIVAAPCVEFARYVLQFPDDRPPDASVTEAVRFLHNGTRGYYAAYGGREHPISRGARVIAR